MADNNPLVKEIFIDASPEVVFAFLSEPDKMLRWTGLTMDVDPRPGGVFCLNPTFKEAVRGEYLEVVFPHRIVFTGDGRTAALAFPQVQRPSRSSWSPRVVEPWSA